MHGVDLFDVVELIVDVPQRALYAGMQGTVLDIHGDGEAFEVEFSDEQGQVLSFLALSAEQFVVIWRAQQREWVPLAERIAELVARLPEPTGAEVLDFARFLSSRTQRLSRSPAVPWQWRRLKKNTTPRSFAAPWPRCSSFPR